MPAIDQTSLRKAALALHALPDGDQSRVWERLDAGRREALAPLLDELVALGIPKGRRWVPDDEPGVMESSPRDLIWRQSPDVMATLLTAQSVDAAVSIMRIASWPWLDAVVADWPPEQRHAVRTRLEQGGAIPSRLADELMGLVANALTKRAVVVGQTPVPVTHQSVRPVRRSWYSAVMSLFMLT